MTYKKSYIEIYYIKSNAALGRNLIAPVCCCISTEEDSTGRYEIHISHKQVCAHTQIQRKTVC